VSPPPGAAIVFQFEISRDTCGQSRPRRPLLARLGPCIGPVV